MVDAIEADLIELAAEKSWRSSLIQETQQRMQSSEVAIAQSAN